uniref:Uncharacterized protein ycf35 n=1 Tax=Laurenciella marilzae TaxID=1413812 RepID=A0A1Z1M0Y1_9FLOR|nr:hypothetical protein [Laurenciella marilzae]ARW59716.1 hypothetical protein [Laurenciella marilzae]
MSHFSKIQTNIYDSNLLVKTLNNMGFVCKYSNDCLSSKDIFVYSNSSENYLFAFTWDGTSYNLLADLQLWTLSTDINYFIDTLSQKYAYNMILSQSVLSGFSKISETVAVDGSIKVRLKRWSSSDK